MVTIRVVSAVGTKGYERMRGEGGIRWARVARLAGWRGWRGFREFLAVVSGLEEIFCIGFFWQGWWGR